MLSAIISICVATRHCFYYKKQPKHQGHNQPSPLVLGQNIFFFYLIADRDQTVSRRSEPNSRTTLIGEQPNPWNHFQLQDVMSRHRGAKRPRR